MSNDFPCQRCLEYDSIQCLKWLVHYHSISTQLSGLWLPIIQYKSQKCWVWLVNRNVHQWKDTFERDTRCWKTVLRSGDIDWVMTVVITLGLPNRRQGEGELPWWKEMVFCYEKSRFYYMHLLYRIEQNPRKLTTPNINQ